MADSTFEKFLSASKSTCNKVVSSNEDFLVCDECKHKEGDRVTIGNELWRVTFTKEAKNLLKRGGYCKILCRHCFLSRRSKITPGKAWVRRERGDTVCPVKSGYCLKFWTKGKCKHKICRKSKKHFKPKPYWKEISNKFCVYAFLQAHGHNVKCPWGDKCTKLGHEVAQLPFQLRGADVCEWYWWSGNYPEMMKSIPNGSKCPDSKCNKIHVRSPLKVKILERHHCVHGCLGFQCKDNLKDQCPYAHPYEANPWTKTSVKNVCNPVEFGNFIDDLSVKATKSDELLAQEREIVLAKEKEIEESVKKSQTESLYDTVVDSSSLNSKLSWLPEVVETVPKPVVETVPEPVVETVPEPVVETVPEPVKKSLFRKKKKKLMPFKINRKPKEVTMTDEEKVALKFKKLDEKVKKMRSELLEKEQEWEQHGSLEEFE